MDAPATPKLGTFNCSFDPSKAVITAPATDAAKQWAGRGTALKPAHEPIVMARKPLAGRVIDNIRAWGCGGINVDGCRIGGNGGTKHGDGEKGTTKNCYGNGLYVDFGKPVPGLGRFPANLILSHSPNCVKVGRKKIKSNCRPNCYGNEYIRTEKECQVIPGTPYVAPEYADASGHEEIDDYVCSEDCAIRLMGEQSGICKSGGAARIPGKSNVSASGWTSTNRTAFNRDPDTGTAARFFLNIDPDPFIYCSKASPTERQGCKHPTIKPLNIVTGKQIGRAHV